MGLLALSFAASAWAAGQAAPADAAARPQTQAGPAGEEAPELPPELSVKLLRLPDYAQDEDGRVIDRRTGKRVTREQAEAALARVRTRAAPDKAGAALAGRNAQPRLYFPHLGPAEAEKKAKELDATKRKALRVIRGFPGTTPELASGKGPSSAVAALDAAGAARAAAARPRAQLPASLRRRSSAPPPPQPPAAGPPAGVSQELNGLLDEFSGKLAGVKEDDTEEVKKEKLRKWGLGQGWAGNALYGYRCQLVHDSFKDVIEKRRLAERYPGAEFVGLYQPGVASSIPFMSSVGNHIFIGVIDKPSGRVTHYFDPWANKKVTKFTGKDDLPLDRAYLEVRPWNGTGAYRVDDRGRRIR